MRYLLAVLTHGDNADVITRTVESFDRMVTPRPHRRLVVMDGPAALPPAPQDDAMPWAGYPIEVGPVGYCRAVGTTWAAAVACKSVDYVFWMEHDFTFDRPVDLRDMAAILDGWPSSIAQVSLMRHPVSAVEDALGGVVGDHRERGAEFLSRETTIPESCRDVDWLEHGAYFTTNPSLMRRDFMQANPWPTHMRECEGRYGLALAQAGYRFAILGDGEPWVTHIGERTGKGY